MRGVKFIVVREWAMDIRHVAVLLAQRVLLRECRTLRQDKCECGMDILHLTVFFVLRILADERVQNCPSSLV